MELFSHCYHIFNTRGCNEDMFSLFQMMSKEQCANNDIHMKKHSDLLIDNDIIMMASDWLIDNDMLMKKHFDWLTYGAMGIIMMGSKVGMAFNIDTL